MLPLAATERRYDLRRMQAVRLSGSSLLLLDADCPRLRDIQGMRPWCVRAGSFPAEDPPPGTGIIASR